MTAKIIYGVIFELQMKLNMLPIISFISFSPAKFYRFGNQNNTLLGTEYNLYYTGRNALYETLNLLREFFSSLPPAPFAIYYQSPITIPPASILKILYL
jgi:hypothetical protein